MKRIAGIALAALAAASAGAVEITQVIVRQQWPWSTDVKVDYSIAGVTSPVDVQVQFFEGSTEITPVGSPSAIKGELHGITASGEKCFRFNPKEVFGAERAAIFDLKVRLTPVAAAANNDEVIYKIVDLSKLNRGASVCITDVTRREILNGDYGSYETDFGRIGPGFTTQVSDVLIWTGVTNDVAYKKEKLVLRKIPAAGKSYKMGIPGSTDANQVCVDVSFEHDFWMGVFELTTFQRRYTMLTWVDSGGNPYRNWETNEQYSAELRPANMLYWSWARGNASGKDWPQDGHSGLYLWDVLGRLYAHTGLYFDLPTEAEWEFAARAGTTNALYSGKAYTSVNFAEVGRGYGINCRTANQNPEGDNTTWPSRNCSLEFGCNIVGSYRPNAYGLYDTLGNALEWCLDKWNVNDLPTGGTDPRGSLTFSDNVNPRRVFRGGSYRYQFNNIGYRGCGITSYNTQDFGCRVCLHEVD